MNDIILYWGTNSTSTCWQWARRRICYHLLGRVWREHCFTHYFGIIIELPIRTTCFVCSNWPVYSRWDGKSSMKKSPWNQPGIQVLMIVRRSGPSIMTIYCCCYPELCDSGAPHRVPNSDAELILTLPPPPGIWLAKHHPLDSFFLEKLIVQVV